MVEVFRWRSSSVCPVISLDPLLSRSLLRELVEGCSEAPLVLGLVGDSAVTPLVR